MAMEGGKEGSNRVLQGSILELVLFNNIHERSEEVVSSSVVAKSAKDSELVTMVKT